MIIKSMVITGATSSLGCALVDECIRNNTKVLALVNPGSLNINRITKHESVTIRECGLADMASFADDTLGKYDAMVHLAWGATHGDGERDMLVPQVKNIEYALDAVALAGRLGCKVFVGAGSQAEYGRTEEVLTEKTATNPETPYGIAKLSAGSMTRIACRNLGIRHIWPRILSTYGPKYLPGTVVNYTIMELLHGRRPSLSGGDQIWDFLYNEDAARALYLLTQKGTDGEIYVVGSGKSAPLKSYLHSIREVMLANKDIIMDSKNSIDIDRLPELGLGDKPYGPNTVMHLSCNIDKLRKDTGFEPSVNFEDGILKTIIWNRDHLYV